MEIGGRRRPLEGAPSNTALAHRSVLGRRIYRRPQGSFIMAGAVHRDGHGTTTDAAKGTGCGRSAGVQGGTTDEPENFAQAQSSSVAQGVPATFGWAGKGEPATNGFLCRST